MAGSPPVFEDFSSCANGGSSSKSAGQPMSWCSSVENLALLDNGSNGDSVPASVPAWASSWLAASAVL
jgi:hypothetical protein